MSVYLGSDEITKQYLRSLAGGRASAGSGSTNGFTMSGDINMNGNEVIGLDDPSVGSSATNKKYVDDEIAKIPSSGGVGLSQAAADSRYLRKTDASSTYETQSDASNTYLSKTDATNTYVSQTALGAYSDSATIDTNFLKKTDAATTYAPVDASYTKSESDQKYSLKGSGSGGGGLSASGFTMTGDIDMGDNKILKLSNPTLPKSAANKEYVDNNFLSKHGGLILGSVNMGGQSITNLNPTPQGFNDAVTKKYVDDSIGLAGGLSITGITMSGDIDMDGHNVTGLSDPTNDDMAASKGYVDGNFLDLAGGAMVGNVDMGGYEIKNMLRTPTTDLSAVTKKWVSDEFPTKQEVLGGFTLSGALNLSGNEIYGLPDTPTRDNSAASKRYVDGKVTGSGGGPSTSGFSMTGDIDMQQNEIFSLPDVPSRDHSAVSKKYVTDNFCNTSGDTMTGDLSMGGRDVTNLPDAPTTDNSAGSKKYVDGKVAGGGGLSDSGFAMKGDINMGGYEVIGVTSVPSFNNSIVNKKYVDDEVSAITRGISQVQADARYLRLTKYEYDNWMDTFVDMNSAAIVWSDHVRKSVIDSDTNLEIRTISVNTSLSAATIKAREIEIYINYAYTKNVKGVNKILTSAKLLTTIDLSSNSYAAMEFKGSGTLHSFHIDDGHYLGNDTEATNSLLWQIGVMYGQHATTVGLNDECYVSFALNKAGQYG